MENIHLTTLRDKTTVNEFFRKASDKLAQIMAVKTIDKLDKKTITIETPITKTEGFELPKELMVVPILRAGLALLPAFMETVPNVSVGILGIERTDDNSGVREYYKKFPTAKAQNVIILDPMLATGNSAILAVDFIKRLGYENKQIYFTGILASREGFERLAESIPRENITITAVDAELNDKQYIVPGLGDYGDRYFGTNH